MSPARRSLTLRLVFGLAAIAVLGSVFALYIEPEFVIALANQVWACF